MWHTLDDGEPFGQKTERLVAELREQQAEGAYLDAAITQNMRGVGVWGAGGTPIGVHCAQALGPCLPR